MEYTFDVGFKTDDGFGSYIFKVALTEEQSERLKASYKSGQFTFMDDDDEIWDIVCEVQDTIDQISEEGDTADTQFLSYPTELESHRR